MAQTGLGMTTSRDYAVGTIQNCRGRGGGDQPLPAGATWGILDCVSVCGDRIIGHCATKPGLRMHESSLLAEQAKSTSGLFHYLDKSVRPSLYRNGEVLTRRDRDGNDYGTNGLLPAEMELAVHDARMLDPAARKTCRYNGFELLDAPLGDAAIDFFDHDDVVRRYYGLCTDLVAENTGAHAFAFDHNIRSASGKQSQKRTAGGQFVQEPLHMVHGDYTLYSGPQRLRDLTQPPRINDTYRTVLDAGESLISPEDAERALGCADEMCLI